MASLRGVNSYLCKAVEDSYTSPNPAPQDVGHQEVDSPSLHLAPLAHPYSTEGHDQYQKHGDKDHQDGQQNTSIPLNYKTHTVLRDILYVYFSLILCTQS